MEQKDLFKRQIDQLGKALAKVLSELTGLDSGVDVSSRMSKIESVFQSELNRDFKSLMALNNNEFINLVTKELNISIENFENLADLILIYSEGAKSKSDYHQKALNLYDYLQKNSKDYSYNIQMKIEKVQKLIQQP